MILIYVISLHYIIENWKDNETYNKILDNILSRNDVATFINESGVNGDTPLIIATKKNNISLCKKLDSLGADKNKETKSKLHIRLL